MDVGTLIMKINADTKGIQDGISKASSMIGNFGASALKGAAIVGGALGAGLSFAVADGIKGIMEMEEQTAQLEAVLKSTGNVAGVTAEKATSLAESLEKTTRFSAESALAAENLLLTFTNIGKDVFPEATKTALDMAQALGGDAAGQSVALGKALNDPIAGISALTRVGVTFTDEQKNMIKSMVEAGDVAAAQTVILDELQKEFGGSAEAAGKTFAGQLDILKNMLGEVFESLAITVMPILQQFTAFVIANMPVIQSTMQTVFNVISDVVSTVYDWFKVYLLPVLLDVFEWVKSNMPAIQATFSTVFGVISTVIKTVWDIISNDLIPIFEDLWYLIKPTLPLISAAFKVAFDIIVGAIKIVIDTFATLISIIKETVIQLEKFFKKQAEQPKASSVSGFGGSSAGLVGGIISGQRANGGPVSAGKSYLINERLGGEVFTPSQNGYVSNQQQPQPQQQQVIMQGGGYSNATIIIQLDGKQIGKMIGAPLMDTIRVKTGIR